MKKAAFTLFEVILAIGIIVVASSVIINIQMRSLFRVLRDHDEIERLFWIKKALYAPFIDPPEKLIKTVKKLENPEITLTTQVTNLSPKSSLAEVKDYLKIVQTEGQWKYTGGQQSLVMVTFIPRSAKEREKEKKK